MYDDIGVVDLTLITTGIIVIGGQEVPLSDVARLKELLSPELYQILLDMGVPLGGLSQTGTNMIQMAILIGIIVIICGIILYRYLNRKNKYVIGV